MIYADYEYYCDVYRGTVDADSFCRLATRASSFLDYYTQNRAKDYAELDAVKMCCCSLVDQYMLIDTAQELARKNVSAGLASEEGELQSETVGGYSRTLRSGGDSSVAALKAASEAKAYLASIVREYLAHTGLVYRGGCFPCTHPTS